MWLGKQRLIDFTQATAWRERRLRESSNSADFNVARAEKMQAEAELAQLTLRERKGKLMDVAIHEQRLATICERLAAVCTSGLSQYTSDVQRALSAADAQALLEKIGDAMLRALSRDVDDAGVEEDAA